eukprot:CAMPEP_0184856494 /NCGR_PEP_ID=MMETSP0580-20130426/1680_1 /TAXON_ID=1118495 /ORGANISM="Dactyliosolen fragilissimus" /LENGTH=376 /DNA_ID=CAMNT_0027351565 /DNA_START=69 /DNA_END=1196 /DNA_ORIENTATION=-
MRSKAVSMTLALLMFACLFNMRQYHIENELLINVSSDSTKRFRTLDNIASHHHNSRCPEDYLETEVATTLVTHLPLDQLELLDHICRSWLSSPIVAVIYISSSDVKNKVKWNSKLSKYKKTCHNLEFKTFISNQNARGIRSTKSEAYPVNKLRNVGLDAVKTSHVLVTDVHFIPSKNLDTHVAKTIDVVTRHGIDRTHLKSKNYHIDGLHPYVLVVPSHDENTTDTDTDADADTDTRVQAMKCISIDDEPNFVMPWCPSANINQYNHVFFETEREQIPSKRIRAKAFLDIVKDPWKPLSPYFDERFSSNGKDKVQYILHLLTKGFEFTTMPPPGYIIHHPYTPHISEPKNSKDYKSLFKTYKKELEKKYGKLIIMW